MRAWGIRMIAVVAIALAAVGPSSSGAQMPSSGGTPVSCTVWHPVDLGTSLPDGCGLSDGWWTSWADCAITPVHNEPWMEKGHGAGLAGIPWIPIPMGMVGATAHLFFGNRPLPVGDTFPDGSAYTKVLWTFSEPVRDFGVTAMNAGRPDSPVDVVETGPANTSSDSSNEWPSYLAVPDAGCWTFTLTATTRAGEVVTGTFTYVAVA